MFDGEIRIALPAERYEELVAREFMLSTLIDAILEEASLSYDGERLVLDYNARHMFEVLRAMFPLRYQNRIAVLKRQKEEEHADND